MKPETARISVAVLIFAFTLTGAIVLYVKAQKVTFSALEDVSVFEIDGMLVPTNAFILEIPNDQCEFHHFVAKYDTVYAVDGTEIENPGPGLCEYGRMKDMESMTTSISVGEWNHYERLYE